MLVLDEQLTGRGLERACARWYRGAVRFIHELRPETLVKDEVVPSLLHRQRSPTFVTINVSDFWRRVAIDRRFCVVCFALDDSEVPTLDRLLRALLRHPRFCTKAKHMGCVIRVSGATVTYYRHDDPTIRFLDQDQPPISR